jgi:hypothetical protein
MPAAACDDSRPYQSTINGECDFMVDWTWDGSSTPFPGGCQGTIDSISWENRSASTYYAHADIRGDLILDRFPPIAAEILIQ